ncbi:MAG: hypothetical protein QME96_13255 [Myxococcota bacterium]|nr:hypothetical protein [Myxococcota bacterium]
MEYLHLKRPSASGWLVDRYAGAVWNGEKTADLAPEVKRRLLVGAWLRAIARKVRSQPGDPIPRLVLGPEALDALGETVEEFRSHAGGWPADESEVRKVVDLLCIPGDLRSRLAQEVRQATGTADNGSGRPQAVHALEDLMFVSALWLVSLRLAWDVVARIAGRCPEQILSWRDPNPDDVPHDRTASTLVGLTLYPFRPDVPEIRLSRKAIDDYGRAVINCLGMARSGRSEKRALEDVAKAFFDVGDAALDLCLSARKEEQWWIEAAPEHICNTSGQQVGCELLATANRAGAGTPLRLHKFTAAPPARFGDLLKCYVGVEKESGPETYRGRPNRLARRAQLELRCLEAACTWLATIQPEKDGQSPPSPQPFVSVNVTPWLLGRPQSSTEPDPAQATTSAPLGNDGAAGTTRSAETGVPWLDQPWFRGFQDLLRNVWCRLDAAARAAQVSLMLELTEGPLLDDACWRVVWPGAARDQGVAQGMPVKPWLGVDDNFGPGADVPRLGRILKGAVTEFDHVIVKLDYGAIMSLLRPTCRPDCPHSSTELCPVRQGMADRWAGILRTLAQIVDHSRVATGAVAKLPLIMEGLSGPQRCPHHGAVFRKAIAAALQELSKDSNQEVWGQG